MTPPSPPSLAVRGATCQATRRSRAASRVAPPPPDDPPGHPLRLEPQTTCSARVLFVQHYDDCPPGLVGDRLAGLGATVEIVSAHARRLPDPAGYDLVVPLGSHDSALDDSLPYLRREWELLAGAVAADVPVFGICFGAQLLCRVLGGAVHRMPEPEIGWLPVRTGEPGLIPAGPWLVWHLDALVPGRRSTAVARTGPAVQAFVHGPHAGVQFHPEVSVATLRGWTHRYRDSFDRLDLDPETVLAQAQREEDVARSRADLLVDRVLARIAAAPAVGGPRR